MSKDEITMTSAEASITLSQSADSNDKEDLQFINVGIEDCGGGSYYVIETERWAFDSLEGFFEMVRDAADKFKHLKIEEE